MHAFIILNFLDKINAFNHEKVLYQMSKCTFTFPMPCLFGRQNAKGGPKIQITFILSSPPLLCIWILYLFQIFKNQCGSVPSIFVAALA